MSIDQLCQAAAKQHGGIASFSFLVVRSFKLHLGQICKVLLRRRQIKMPLPYAVNVVAFQACELV